MKKSFLLLYIVLNFVNFIQAGRCRTNKPELYQQCVKAGKSEWWCCEINSGGRYRS